MVAEVNATMIGNKDGMYYVNVRNAHPKGMIGDAGVVRRFETKDEAKAYVRSVNKTGIDTFIPQKDSKIDCTSGRHAGDKFVASNQMSMPSVTLNDRGNEVTIKNAVGTPGTVVLYGPAEEGRPYVEGVYNGQPVKLSQGEVIRLLLAASAKDAYKHFE